MIDIELNYDVSTIMFISPLDSRAVDLINNFSLSYFVGDVGGAGHKFEVVFAVFS